LTFVKSPLYFQILIPGNNPTVFRTLWFKPVTEVRMMTEKRCTLVEITQPMAGFDHFIGSWVFRGDPTFLVDVGPANTASRLIKTLDDMGIDRVDYILLTHIHIDHGGATHALLDRFPMSRVVCHAKGVEHLVDPTRLWEGSLSVLKTKAEEFGRPEGVDRTRVIAHNELRVKDLKVIETPGHAIHHVSYSYDGYLFSGEAAGNYYIVDNGDFLRPATPPRFSLETFLESLDKLYALEDQRICYSHFGEAPSSRHMLQRFRSQILRWERTIKQEMKKDAEDLVSHCIEVLLNTEPDLKAFHRMPAVVRERERYFMANSVKGFLGYLKETS
jgi:glyoxylase-like metal-dependent hydrolase (beta-lactamase superfamily II)